MAEWNAYYQHREEEEEEQEEGEQFTRKLANLFYFALIFGFPVISPVFLS